MAAAGDIGAVDFYRDRDRIKIGDPATLADRLLAAWQHDQDQGLDSLMLAPSRRQVVDLNQRARAARLAGTHLRKSARLTIQTTNAPVAQHDLSRVRASEPGFLWSRLITAGLVINDAVGRTADANE